MESYLSWTIKSVNLEHVKIVGTSWKLAGVQQDTCPSWTFTMQSLHTISHFLSMYHKHFFFLLFLLRGRHRCPLLLCTSNSVQNLAEVAFGLACQKRISLVRPFSFALTFLSIVITSEKRSQTTGMFSFLKQIFPNPFYREVADHSSWR